MCVCVCVCVCVFLLRLYPLSRLLVLVSFLVQFSTYISLRASYLSVEYFEKGLMWPSSLSYDHTHQALSWFSLTWDVDLPWLGLKKMLLDFPVKLDCRHRMCVIYLST